MFTIINMSEVTQSNFVKLFPLIKETLQQARFVSIDLEFSALNPLRNHAPSLFDSPTDRYYKLKKNVEYVIPLQIGITAFTYDSKRNSYLGTIFDFYVQPASFQFLHKHFFFQSSTINFLKLYHFNFNKFAYHGISYINRTQELELREKLRNNEISEVNCTCKTELEKIVESKLSIVTTWYLKAKEEDFLIVVSKVSAVCNREIEYFLHKIFRQRFDNLWTYVESDDFIVKKLSIQRYKAMDISNNLDPDLVDSLLGFTKVFRLIESLNIPIIGHNLLQDLLLMVSSFESELPNSYNDFKSVITNLFPIIFDTRTISNEMRSSLPEEKRWNDRGLDTIFDYFKNGVGRHIVSNSPAIEVKCDQENMETFHDAGWDSFCTGYIFIRLAHLNLYQNYPRSKSFVPNELIGGLLQYKNRVNIIRGSISTINLGGTDPDSTRPPYLIIESVKNKPLNICQVTAILGSFGFIEVKKIPFQRQRALVAVDNFGNAKKILNNFRNHQEFRIFQYSALKHSVPVRMIIAGSVAIVGAVILWLAIE
ncbi:pre-piRNA 3'-exonuclease trimmer-like [Cylas formicarius]|uniref:pre-piRNA 3'-exonuclease trimmer-like n=1 Tax=Cylas formicarius TaxID=197179 RepID=UPI00295875DA|nr:pre-piRNA 3'-exonuclease trimmer-like [Cylas formicarius]